LAPWYAFSLHSSSWDNWIFLFFPDSLLSMSLVRIA
jgi:hypothetical protein